jgi:lipoprotein-releasing system ATP-binding protein
MALVNYPIIVIGDEPTGDLDFSSRPDDLDLLRKLNKERNQTFIRLTHDEQMAKKTDRIVRLVDGRVFEYRDA